MFLRRNAPSSTRLLRTLRALRHQKHRQNTDTVGRNTLFRVIIDEDEWQSCCGKVRAAGHRCDRYKNTVLHNIHEPLGEVGKNPVDCASMTVSDTVVSLPACRCLRSACATVDELGAARKAVKLTNACTQAVRIKEVEASRPLTGCQLGSRQILVFLLIQRRTRAVW